MYTQKISKYLYFTGIYLIHLQTLPVQSQIINLQYRKEITNQTDHILSILGTPTMTIPHNSKRMDYGPLQGDTISFISRDGLKWFPEKVCSSLGFETGKYSDGPSSKERMIFNLDDRECSALLKDNIFEDTKTESKTNLNLKSFANKISDKRCVRERSPKDFQEIIVKCTDPNNEKLEELKNIRGIDLDVVDGTVSSCGSLFYLTSLIVFNICIP